MDAVQSEMIEHLFVTMYDGMIAYARSVLNRESLAEEAVQETFRIACMKPDALCSSPNPKGWLVNTLKMTMNNMRRSMNYTVLLLNHYTAQMGEEHATTVDVPDPDLLYGDIADTEEYRLLRELAIDGKSHLEMAQARGISVDACKKRVQRAREFLRGRLRHRV